MTIILATLGASLLWFCALSPTLAYVRDSQERAYQRQLRYFKLIAIKKYHPAFQEHSKPGPLPFEEIARRYNVNNLYDQIGKF